MYPGTYVDETIIPSPEFTQKFALAAAAELSVEASKGSKNALSTAPETYRNEAGLHALLFSLLHGSMFVVVTVP
jgi:hypothetical protein